MSTTDAPHPDRATLAAYRGGQLTAAGRRAVADHLTRCPTCSGAAAADTPTIQSPVEPLDVPEPLVDHPRYRVLDRLGEGGMGVVYRAEHRVMGRVVALKVLNAGVTANPVAVDRFRREVRLASRLNHPNIVTAYDADEAGGLHFLVMEFVEGSSLDGLVRGRGPLPVGLACECARQAAVGLQHAHEKGMVHRDVKPHNLMLARTGQVKILDFGLACVAAASGADPNSVTAHALTQAHTLLGTPDFLSPEQARTAAVDVRSDLYSLGCTLYFLLTGKPPYGGVGAYAKMIAHVNDPVPDLAAARPDAPPELVALLRKLMAKAPEDRYQTPTEVAAALLPFAAAVAGPGGEHALGPPPFGNSGATSGGDTHPSYARDAATATLPVAVECEPSAADLPQRKRSAPAAPVQQAAKRRPGWLALGAMVLLGLAVGGLVTQRHRFLGTADELKPTGKDRSDEQAAAPGPRPDPVPAVHKDAPHPHPTPPVTPAQPTPPKPVAGPPKPGPADGPKPPPPAVPPRKKQFLLIVPADFQSGELSSVQDVLKQHGAGTSVVAAEKKPLDGYKFVQKVATFDRTLDPAFAAHDVTASMIDAADAVVVLAGNPSSFDPKGAAGPDFARIVKRMIQQKKPVGAVGSGILELGWHGLLEQAEVSTYAGHPLSVAKLKVKKWTADPKVVVDRPFVTAGEYGHARELTEEILKAIPEHPAK